MYYIFTEQLFGNIIFLSITLLFFYVAYKKYSNPSKYKNNIFFINCAPTNIIFNELVEFYNKSKHDNINLIVVLSVSVDTINSAEDVYSSPSNWRSPYKNIPNSDFYPDMMTSPRRIIDNIDNFKKCQTEISDTWIKIIKFLREKN